MKYRPPLAGSGGEAQVSVVNNSTHAIEARLRAQIVTAANVVRAAGERTISVLPGTHSVVLPLIQAAVQQEDSSNQRWDRLRYDVRYTQDQNPIRIEGAIALTKATPELFDLYVSRLQRLVAGSPYAVRILAQHPLTAKAVRGVTIEAKLELADDLILERRAKTDRSGNAFLSFDIPRDIEPEDGKLIVTGVRGTMEQQLSSDLEFATGQIIVTTDKPIYQPGQELHIRGLVVSPQNRVAAGKNVVVIVMDQDDTTVFRQPVTSSRFGIVRADWQIPQNQLLGHYRVAMNVDDEDSYWLGGAFIRLSRYELPTFLVQIKPDKGYYIPGEDAKVEVRGDYLFGKPVKRGKVRVVRESRRYWNYEEQKYDVEEEDEYKGELDADGRFLATVKLTREYNDLGDSRYRQFRDLSFAAYLTDESTGRTEQRRFDLRISRNPIHLYLIPDTPLEREDHQEANFYISAQYADGSPCQCQVSVSRSVQIISDGRRARTSLLRTVRTNKYGLARVSGLKVRDEDEDETGLSLRLEAGDGKERIGTRDEDLNTLDDTAIRVSTDKALYRAGEPITVEIQAAEERGLLVVQAESHNKIVQSEMVNLRRGRASLTIPYSSELRDEVVIVAYQLGRARRSRYARGIRHGGRTVLYPRRRGLRVDVHLDKAIYKPGEEAQAEFRIRALQGGGIEGVLGVGIVDSAVDARARTDEEFSRGYSYWPRHGGYWFSYDTIAGFTRTDLDNVDLTEPISAELDLLAEVVLSTSSEQFRFDIDSSENTEAPAQAFRQVIERDLEAVMAAAKQEAETTGAYAHDQEALAKALKARGIDWSTVRDPWGNAYRAEFSTLTQQDRLSLISAGPDEAFGTDDDFEAGSGSWPYFSAPGKLINRAASEYHQRTGSFVRDAVTLKAELTRLGLDIDKLRDRWGQPYLLNFGINRRYYSIIVASGGPDRSYGVTGTDYDDFVVWTSNTDYLLEIEQRIGKAIAEYHRHHVNFPENETDLDQALAPAGLGLADKSMRDLWGNPYYPVFSGAARYADRLLITQKDEQGGQQIESRPVTRWLKYVRIASCGPDGIKGTLDDFDLGHYSAIVFEQAANDASPQRTSRRITLAGSRGGIVGTVIDQQGAVIPNATITVQSISTSAEPATAQTDTYGEFVIANLPAGEYSLRADAPGFRSTRVSNVKVVEGSLTQVNVTLSIGATAEVVTVESDASIVNTESASMVKVSSLPLSRKVVDLAQTDDIMALPISTPRLREYFPETLLWEPELITDRRGRSRLKFKVADNITSWKVAVLASDVNGELGSAEKQFTAFQPFFVDHDPPPVLTQNDEISLPVVLRNYLAKPQAVELEIKPETWFTLLGESRKTAEVPATDSARTVFPFRAVASVVEGRQRVTAVARQADDAIERKVTVHPDGEERTLTQAKIFSELARFDVNIPSHVIAGSSNTELRVYPSLHAQLRESIEGILQRPYGCGEQTISSAYPSLMALRAYKQAGIADTAETRRALRYLQAGYDRLLSYRSSGGFSYWGREEPDLALTAYAVRFLTDARPFIAVDDNILVAARRWLFKQQQSNGGWTSSTTAHAQESWRQVSITSYITRVLAMSETQETAETDRLKEAQNLRRALGYLGERVQQLHEPYLLANHVLAAWALGEKPKALEGAGRLRKLAHESNDSLYWELQENTPFYGWGRAGRLETTAVVVLALTQTGGKQVDDPLLLRAVRFLTANKDRYGVWYSGQATVNVLEALIAAFGKDNASDHTAGSLSVKVNGQLVRTIPMPSAKDLAAPIVVNLSEMITPGTSTIELVRTAGVALGTAQIVSAFYVPWANSQAGTSSTQVPGDSDRLQLAVRFDKTKAVVGEEIRCTVEAQRIGFRGHGMMLAEVGLPPGADVDRSSLEKAATDSGWALNHYDVLPDRVVAYMWPYSGNATQFSFTFRPRLGMQAQTAPSVLYDYYNPEARAVVKPVTFQVQ